MLPSIKAIYEDALILENLRDVIRYCNLTDIDQAIYLWDKASKKIEVIIVRVAQNDLNLGKKILEAWKYARQERDDFRELSYRILKLINVLSDALRRYYSTFDISDNKYAFFMTDSMYLTVKNLKIGKYMHSLDDPMYEASCMARKLYGPQITEFHILGCGLGYLAYAMWEQSEHTAVIHIYEEDTKMVEYAFQAGVLSWIDDDYIRIEDFSDTRDLLAKFCRGYRDDKHDHYISDWKVGTYELADGSEIINAIDYNERMYRIYGLLWKINARENRKIANGTLEEFAEVFKGAGREYVIVSAGPSLDDNIEFIRNNVGKKVIIAINTILRRLADEQIIPDIVVALDPTTRLADHLNGIEEFTKNIPLIMTENASQSFASIYMGKKYIVSDYEKSSDGFEWNFGGTVASFALDIAYYFQASKIYLIGSDLAYSEGRNYAGGVAHEENEGINNDILIESSDGGKVKTNRLYNKYRNIIENQIDHHRDITIVNMSKHGAKIRGTITLP